MSSYSELAEGLLPHVLSAGKIVMGYFGTDHEVETKAGGSPVTAADREAEALLIAALSRIAPGVPVVGEEMMEGRKAKPMGERFFLVDALDGTREFTSGRTEFTINIGLIENGLPTFGVIYAPALERLYLTVASDHAATGELATTAEACSLNTINAKRISVLKDFEEQGPFVLCASRSHGSDALENWLKGKDISARTNIGSSLKFCQVAEGQCHVYPRFGPTMEWDTAAGQAIVQAAGGIVSELNGELLQYGKHETGFRNPFFIASTRAVPSFYQ